MVLKFTKYLLSGLLLTTVLATAAAEPPCRVVSLSPALTELIWKLGAGDRQIGRSDACDYPPAAKAVPVAGKFAQPALERVLELKPDLVVSNDLINPNIARLLRQNGIRVELQQCRNFDDYLWWVATLGRLLDCRAAAAAETRRIEDFRADAARQPRLPEKALWVVWDTPLMVAGGGSFPDMVLDYAGMDNIAEHAGQEYFKCSYDWVLKNPPDVIVWSPPGAPDADHRLWGRLDAVRQNRVVTGLDPDLVQRPGPRLTEGIALLRRKLVEIDRLRTTQSEPDRSGNDGKK